MDAERLNGCNSKKKPTGDSPVGIRLFCINIFQSSAFRIVPGGVPA